MQDRICAAALAAIVAVNCIRALVQESIHEPGGITSQHNIQRL
jgi:hypothetical protein